MATAEFDPQVVIIGCHDEIDRLGKWLTDKHEKFIADFISKPRIRGWFFCREIYYESAEYAEKVWRGDFEEWEFCCKAASPSDIPVWYRKGLGKPW